MTQDDLDLSHKLYSASSRAFREGRDYPEAIAHRLARDHEEALALWQEFSDRVAKAIRAKLLYCAVDRGAPKEHKMAKEDNVIGPWKKEEP